MRHDSLRFNFFFFTSHNLHYEYDDSVVLFYFIMIPSEFKKMRKIKRWQNLTKEKKGEKMEGRSNPLRYPVAAGKPRCYLSFILIPSIIIIYIIDDFNR